MCGENYKIKRAEKQLYSLSGGVEGHAREANVRASPQVASGLRARLTLPVNVPRESSVWMRKPVSSPAPLTSQSVGGNKEQNA